MYELCVRMSGLVYEHDLLSNNKLSDLQKLTRSIVVLPTSRRLAGTFH